MVKTNHKNLYGNKTIPSKNITENLRKYCEILTTPYIKRWVQSPLVDVVEARFIWNETRRLGNAGEKRYPALAPIPTAEPHSTQLSHQFLK